MKKKPIKKSEVKQQGIIEIPEWAAYVFFALTTIVFFWGHLAGSSFFWEDFVEYVYPVQTFAARESSLFDVPFWNPYIFSGMPFLADIQTGFFYLPHRLLNFFVDDSGHLSVWFLQFIVIAHFFFAQFSLYKLARHWGISVTSAMVSAVSYGFSFMLVLHVIHPMMLFHLTWLPLILMYFDRAIINGNLKAGFAGGLILGLTLLSGHPQSTLYIFMFLGLYLAWMIISKARKSELSKPAMQILAPVLTFVIAVGIYQVQLMPSQELAENSRREEMTYEAASEGSMMPKQFITMVVPKYFGTVVADRNAEVPFQLSNPEKGQAPYYYYWETGFYFGIIALVFGLFAAISLIGNTRVAFFVFISIFGMIFALGDNSFLHGLFFKLPFFGQFRMPARMLMFMILGFSIMSGWGIDLISKKGKMVNILIPGILVLLISGLAAAGIISGVDNPDAAKFGQSAFVWSAIALIAGVLLVQKKLNPVYAAIALALFAFIDLYFAGNDFNKSEVSAAEQYKIDPSLEKLLKGDENTGLFRSNTRMYSPAYMAAKRNQGMVDRFYTTEGYNPLVLQRVNPAVESVDEIYDLLNARYVLMMDEKSGRPRFAVNADARERAWAVFEKKVIEPEKVELFMKNNPFDFGRSVILEKEDGNSLPSNVPEGYKPEIKFEKYSPDFVEIKIKSDYDCYLVLSEIWYPAWKAEVDGKEREILRANYSLRAIHIKKGESKIVMKYDSGAFKAGFGISIAALIIAILGLVFIKTPVQNEKANQELERNKQ
jgi:hypothetical protein